MKRWTVISLEISDVNHSWIHEIFNNKLTWGGVNLIIAIKVSTKFNIYSHERTKVMHTQQNLLGNSEKLALRPE